MYFENCDCTVCLDICPEESKLKGISFECIQARHPKDCDGENLLTFLKAVVAQSLLLNTITLACEHKFHLKCLLPLMENERTIVKCPNCRRWSTVRSSRDYEVIKNLQILELLHRILRNRLNTYQKKDYQSFFPLSKIKQNENIQFEQAQLIYKAFSQFRKSLFSIAEWLSKRQFGTRLDFSDLQINEFVQQDYFLTQAGQKLSI